MSRSFYIYIYLYLYLYLYIYIYIYLNYMHIHIYLSYHYDVVIRTLSVDNLIKANLINTGNRRADGARFPYRRDRSVVTVRSHDLLPKLCGVQQRYAMIARVHHRHTYMCGHMLKVSVDFFLRDHRVRGIRLAQTLAQSHGHSGSVTPFAPRFYSTERERQRKNERERARAPLFESL